MKVMTKKQAEEYAKLSEKVKDVLKELEPSEALLVLETTKQAYLMAITITETFKYMEKLL